jgi:hypothetical protein
MKTKVEQEEVTESKTANLVKQQIKWINVVLLTALYLIALYALVFVLHRLKLMTLIWGRYRLSVRYTSTQVSNNSFYDPKSKTDKVAANLSRSFLVIYS